MASEPSYENAHGSLYNGAGTNGPAHRFAGPGISAMEHCDFVQHPLTGNGETFTENDCDDGPSCENVLGSLFGGFGIHGPVPHHAGPDVSIKKRVGFVQHAVAADGDTSLEIPVDDETSCKIVNRKPVIGSAPDMGKRKKMKGKGRGPET